MKNEANHNPQAQTPNGRKLALVTVQAGCLTLIMAGLALAVGLFLDARLGTAPQWTLISLVGSMPLAFGGVFWLVRRFVKQCRNVADSEFSSEDGNV